MSRDRRRKGKGLVLLLLGLSLLLPVPSRGADEATVSPRTLSRAPVHAEAGADLVRTLSAQFPALRPRMRTPQAFEDTVWRGEGRDVAGLKARSTAARDLRGTDQAVEVVFPRRASEPLVAEGEGVRVVLRPRGASGATAEIVDGMLVYVGLHEQTDALHIVGEGWTEEYLHLRDTDAPRRFEYELVDVQGASSVRLDHGAVQFFGGDGRGLVIPAPVVVDAIGRRSATAARWELSEAAEGGTRRLVLHLDPTGLDYPLVVDPSFLTGSMAIARTDGLGILLQTGKVLVIAGFPIGQNTVELYDPATGIWSNASPLPAPGRRGHTATLLRDGNVLVVGGSTGAGAAADCWLYDPVGDSWSPTGGLPGGREFHTATLLNDGRVLVAGGMNATVPQPDAFLYDPVAGSWAASGPMGIGRGLHGAALLVDGRVLVAGGLIPGPAGTTTAEVYNPGTGVWNPVGNMATMRSYFALTLLPEGDVLAAGDAVSLTERFNPGTGLWTSTGALAQSRRYPSTTLLPSGKVLIAGGWSSSFRNTTELYDPVLGQWTAGPNLQMARRRHSATMLPDGRVLIAGGEDGTTLNTAELVDVDAPTWATDSTMSTGRTEHTLTPLLDGKVLAAGGVNSQTAEVRDLAGDWSTTGNALAFERWQHTATLLHDGRVLLAGSLHSAAAGRTAELYNPGGNAFVLTDDMDVERSGHTATLLPCGEVLVAGGHDSGSAALFTAERYNPRTGLWRPTGSLQKARWKHTATLLRDGRVLVTGGSDGGPLDSAEVYDPIAETWTELTNKMLAPRVDHQATLLPRGRVLLTGGQGSQDSAELFDPLIDDFASSPSGPLVDRDQGFTATLLPNGRVLIVGGGAAPMSAEVYDPALDLWLGGPGLTLSRAGHRTVVLHDGRVLVAGGGSGGTEVYDLGRGELPGWRPVLGGVTDPLVLGNALNVAGTGFQGLSEGSTGSGYMNSSANYPLVQLHRLDNDAVEWLPVDPTKGWSDTVFDSLPVGRPKPGPTRVTVFTSGIPSLSRILDLQCPPPTINSSPTDQTVCLGGSVTLNVAAAEGGVTWQWRKGGTPLVEGAPFSGSQTAALSITVATLTEAGSYDAVAELACSTTSTTSAAATVSVAADLSTVTATPGSPTSVCTTCTGLTVTEGHSDGGPVTHQWGYRTVSLGSIIDLPGRTASTYQVNGADFPGVGSYLLVVRTTPACGPTVVSNEIPLEVTAAPPGDDVLFFTVTSRSGENVLEWWNPPGYDTVRVRFNTGDPCVYPADATADGVLLGNKTGPMGGRDRLPHSPLVNGTRYCYTIFVDTGGAHSTGRTNSGRPFDTTGEVKWAFHTGVSSMTAPTVGSAGVIAASNDYVLHAMERGLGGGEWPAGWRPLPLGDKVEGRSPIVPVAVGGSNPVIFLGTLDGVVHAVDGTVGGAVAEPWTQAIAAGVSAAPAGMFTDFGGDYDYVLVGTRNPGTDNALVALDPASGTILDAFDNGGGTGNRIGIISGMAAVDYPNKRAYFTSFEGLSGSAATLWALDLGSGPVFSSAWVTQRPLGNIASSPVLMNGRLYVGGPLGGGTVYSIDAATGDSLQDRVFNHGNGPVKGFLFPDRAGSDLYFATDEVVWGLHDDGLSLSNKFAGGLMLPPGDLSVIPTSPVLFIPGSHYVYVGGSDGKLYELDTLGPSWRSVTLGDGSAAVGAPSLDWPNDLIHVGTEAGVFYAVEIPLAP